MITRIFTILVAASLVYSQYIPISSVADDNDCALYLSGPGRTSAFDYNLNLLRGSFPYDGQHTCITYDAVNQAYIDARKRINVATPKGDWKTEDIASVGELMLDISINLARTYGLTYEEIEKGLPLIDTSKTLIREVCPPFLAHVECRAGKYRRFDGLCTNLKHPTWGASMTPFQRLIAPLYSDGINAPRMSVTGRDLPLSRIVSRTIHPDEGFHDHAGTVMVIAWGQFMDHDYTLTGTPLDPFNRNDPEECCNRPPHLKHPYCNELVIPDDDYFYRLFNVKCIDFVRGFPHPRPGCRLGSRQQFNTLTGVLDGNTVYGVNEKFARKLRSGIGGMLRMNPVFAEYGLKDLLPLKLDIPDEGCTRPNKSMYCFEAGEIRVNEQLVLTCMHTLMAREHNRVAQGLAEVNPHWDDETLFQEARRIVIAEIQHITYNEFLPILLGKEVMEKFGLLLNKEGYWDGYDENINPSVIDAFAAAAFRFGHSLLPTAVERWSKAHKFIASKRLSDLIRRPFDLYRAGIFDEYLMGLMNQVAQAMDDSITQEVTNHLFKKPGKRFGMDLVSFNMQRGREFGLPGYMEFRKFCGLPAANSFQELFGSMPNETIQRYESIFDHPSDVDLWSGGVSERPLPGSMLGPTFACVIATQFSYSKRGDRFWYELPNQPSSFSPEQLQEVRKARLARILCDNTDIIDTVQLYPMVLPDHEINPRVPCRSGIIPSMDFTKWADYGGHVSANSNPYGPTTQATFDNPKITNVTDSKSSTPLQEKPQGHYKNSLRRKKRDTTKTETSLRNNSSTNASQILENPLLSDSQTAAIIVKQVSGSEKHDIVTTEAIPPRDQRSDKSPQKFTAETTKDDFSDFNDDLDLFDFFEFAKVSVTEQKQNAKNNEEEVNDNDQGFIPDKTRTEKWNKEEKIPTTVSSDHRNDISEENFGIENFRGKESLGLDTTKPKGRSFIPGDIDTHNSEDDSCSTGTNDRDSADDSRGGSKSGKRVCKAGSGRLEPISSQEEEKYDDKIGNEKTSQEEDLNKSQESLSENAKEQFEYIPLDYKHDDAQNNKKQELNSKKEEEENEENNEDGDNDNENTEENDEENAEENDEENAEENGEENGEENDEENADENDEPIEREDDGGESGVEDKKNNEDESKEVKVEKLEIEKPYIDLGDTSVNIADIVIPDIELQDFNDEYFERLRKLHKSDYDEDDETDDSGEEDYDNEETTDNKSGGENKQRHSRENNDNESNEKNSENSNDNDDNFNFNSGYKNFDINDVKQNIQDYTNGAKYLDEYIHDPTLKTAVEDAISKSQKIEKEPGTGNYYWTLEYGQPL